MGFFMQTAMIIRFWANIGAPLFLIYGIYSLFTVGTWGWVYIAEAPVVLIGGNLIALGFAKVATAWP